jgi:hypothetical protein
MVASHALNVSSATRVGVRRWLDVDERDRNRQVTMACVVKIVKPTPTVSGKEGVDGGVSGMGWSAPNVAKEHIRNIDGCGALSDDHCVGGRPTRCRGQLDDPGARHSGGGHSGGSPIECHCDRGARRLRTPSPHNRWTGRGCRSSGTVVSCRVVRGAMPKHVIVTRRVTLSNSPACGARWRTIELP